MRATNLLGRPTLTPPDRHDAIVAVLERLVAGQEQPRELPPPGRKFSTDEARRVVGEQFGETFEQLAKGGE